MTKGKRRAGQSPSWARAFADVASRLGAPRSVVFKPAEKQKTDLRRFEKLAPATGAETHLSIHLSAQSAFLATQGMFCMAWKR